MPHKQKVNSLDKVMDSLIGGIFSTPEQQKFCLENPQSLLFLDFFIRHALDIHNFIGLFKASYMPAANKTVADSRNTYQTSRYKSFFKVTTEDFRENVYETIRLGYVGIYHKLEAFVNSLGEQRSVLKETFLQDDEEDGIHYEDVFKMLEKEFGVRRTDFKQDFNPRITAIRHTANRVKHDDGFLKGPNDELYSLRPWLGLVPGQRIRIDEKWLMADMEYIRVYIGDIFKLVMNVTMYYVMSELVKSKEGRDEPEYIANYTQLMRQQVDNLKAVIQNTILLLQDKPFDTSFLDRAKGITSGVPAQLAALKNNLDQSAKY